LRWSDINFSTGRISLRRAVDITSPHITKVTKTGSARVIDRFAAHLGETPPGAEPIMSAHGPSATSAPHTKPQVRDLGPLCARGELNPHALSGTRT
jgi:hypothetical protein